jgi:hypothetical protein
MDTPGTCDVDRRPGVADGVERYLQALAVANDREVRENASSLLARWKQFRESGCYEPRISLVKPTNISFTSV